ncbi:helix-turn-helix domain-containing protein [Bradyrhizobium sp. HKCCYLRH1073]
MVIVLDCALQARHGNFCNRHFEYDLWQKDERCQFPAVYKLRAIRRVERGEGVLPVARDLGIARKILYDWIKAWRGQGADGLSGKRGPKSRIRKLMSVATYDDKCSALGYRSPLEFEAAFAQKRAR